MRGFIHFLLSVIFTMGYLVVSFYIFLLFDLVGSVIVIITGVFLIPYSWVYARHLSMRICGDSYNTKEKRLQKELEQQRKINDLEAKIQAQRDMKDLHKEIRNRMKK